MTPHRHIFDYALMLAAWLLTWPVLWLGNHLLELWDICRPLPPLAPTTHRKRLNPDYVRRKIGRCKTATELDKARASVMRSLEDWKHSERCGWLKMDYGRRMAKQGQVVHNRKIWLERYIMNMQE